MTPRTNPKRPLPTRWRRRRGQAMAEYSMVVHVLALAGGVAIITVLPMLMNALNRYLNGLYYMINLAVP
ncbi:hypothetical protein [Melittangium boletus]|uniref:Uncharacterized protein n=1 Tax=Melittangium boletus DSM 14713 TaxID=1294270 RepID=A0A250IEA3_9BACT|nr:hypothetical protein [Melittangium boletus]ATB29467.1 hypothetical protein MEBOL_002917 [Melittangium boletus DSM 14713]